MSVFIAAVAGLAIGAALVWFWMSGKVAALRAALEAEKRGRADDRAANERLNAERERTVREQFAGMKSEMENFTVKALEAREKALAEKNGEQVKNLLAPMHQRLEDFKKAAEESKKANGELGVKIEDFFKGISATSASFGAQAKSFTDALTGANKKQGNWGEAILGQVLENCGLKEGQHFIMQSGSGEGIPDCQVFDPGSAKVLVIDSKMSWTKYEQAYRLPAGAERAAALREHVASVKRHVDELYAADYPNKQVPPREGYQYVPLTAMFVPCDAALAAAIEEDGTLVDYAFRRNVALVSPLTLFGFLQLVSRAWSKYNIDKNTNAIYDEAKKLVGYVDRMFKNLEDLGEALNKAKERYDTVMTLAAKEPSGQCLKGPALKILKLGGKPDKALKSQTLAAPDVMPE